MEACVCEQSPESQQCSHAPPSEGPHAVGFPPGEVGVCRIGKSLSIVDICLFGVVTAVFCWASLSLQRVGCFWKLKGINNLCLVKMIRKYRFRLFFITSVATFGSDAWFVQAVCAEHEGHWCGTEPIVESMLCFSTWSRSSTMMVWSSFILVQRGRESRTEKAGQRHIVRYMIIFSRPWYFLQI